MIGFWWGSIIRVKLMKVFLERVTVHHITRVLAKVWHVDLPLHLKKFCRKLSRVFRFVRICHDKWNAIYKEEETTRSATVAVNAFSWSGVYSNTKGRIHACRHLQPWPVRFHGCDEQSVDPEKRTDLCWVGKGQLQKSKEYKGKVFLGCRLEQLIDHFSCLCDKRNSI